MSTLSPSINIIEQDQSIYTIASSNTVLAVVGYATLGPINTATMVNSYSQFQQAFGLPTSLGYSNLAVQNAFQNGNQVIFYRVAETTGTYATTQSQKVITNGQAFVPGYTNFTRSSDVLPGTANYTPTGVYDLNVTASTGDAGAGSVKTLYLYAPSSGRWAMTDVVNQINTQAAATYGYQEFGNTATTPTMVPGTYSFKLSKESSALFGGNSNSFEVTSADTLSSIASTIGTSVLNGSRGNTIVTLGTAAMAAVTAFVSGGGLGINTPIGLTYGSYNFQVKIDAGSYVTINLTGITTSTTYANLISMINYQYAINGINGVCTFNNIAGSYGLYFASKTRGASSICTINVGTTAGSNFLLFATSALINTATINIVNTIVTSVITTGTLTGVAGSAGVTVAVNPYTQRIRITTTAVGTLFPGTTATSSVTIAAGIESADFIASFMGAVDTARPGQGASGVVATLDSNSLIRISAITSTTSPTVADTGASTSDGLTNTTTLRISGLFPIGTAQVGTAQIFNTNADMIQFVATQNGSSGNLIQVVKSSTTNPAVYGVISATIGSGGTGYIAGDIGKTVTIVGGSGTATGIITNVAAGAVTGFTALEPGSSYINGTTSATTSNTTVSTATAGSGLTVVISTGAPTVNTIQVYYNGGLQETFNNVSMIITDPYYFATVMNQAVSSGGSAWVDVNVYPYLNPNDGLITFPNGTYTLGVADNTATEVAYNGVTTIGSYNYKPGTDGIAPTSNPALFVSAFSSSSDLANADYFNYHILITPDNVEQPVQDAAIALANTRMDFIYIVDTPVGLTYSQVVAWHNGLGNGRTTPISSSYCACYWPWVKTFDSHWQRYSWCPPSVFIAALYMATDNNYAPWYAPAGNARGVIVASDVELNVSQPQRDALYGGLNCVNPIVKFASSGIVVYGQKTAVRSTSALNRVNVRRMIIQMKKAIRVALNNMIFEPNDPDSWGRATDLVTSILESIRQGGGITQYAVVIDSTTNTANVIAQNMMNGIIKIVPASTIEVINLSLNIYQSGTTITDAV